MIQYNNEPLEYEEWRLFRQQRSRERFGLSKREWTCFRMIYFEGYKQSEVGMLLGITTVSVGQYQYSAKQKIWEKLNETFGNEQRGS